jgi:hypothetical protein
VPIYEVLKVPGEDDKVILVMPLLRDWDSPPFETVGEGVDFFQQLFEVCTLETLYLQIVVNLPGLVGLAIYAQTACGSPV